MPSRVLCARISPWVTSRNRTFLPLRAGLLLTSAAGFAASLPFQRGLAKLIV